MKLRINRRGDTIVEVLLAIAVASAVLGGAFTVTNHSYINIRDAQERSEALTLLQGQVEQLRASADTFSFLSQSNGSVFCFAVNGGGIQAASTNSVSVLPSLYSDDFQNNYTAPCQQQPQNGVTYYLAVEYDANSHVFTAHARWDRLGGGQDEVYIAYKQYGGS